VNLNLSQALIDLNATGVDVNNDPEHDTRERDSRMESSRDPADTDPRTGSHDPESQCPAIRSARVGDDTALAPEGDMFGGPVPIPAMLSHLPVVAGLVVPWITATTAQGQPVFGRIDAARQVTCLRLTLCQICGKALEDRVVLLVRNSDLERRFTAEPGLHPWCAAYTIKACPMVAGRMDRYRATPRAHDPRTAHGASLETDDALSSLIVIADALRQDHARRGAPAEPWSSVWVADYEVVWDPTTTMWSASFAHTPVLKVRQVADLLDATRPAHPHEHTRP
jgi:hypothetical protein